jgi:hypothetical protein
MRKLKAFFMLMPVLVLAACSGGGPEAVAEKFVKAVYTADFLTAKEYCTEDTKQTIDFIAAFAAEKKEEMQKADIKIELKTITIAEDGNSADVELTVLGSLDLQKGEVVEAKEEKIHLVKVDDKWLVEYKLK